MVRVLVGVVLWIFILVILTPPLLFLTVLKVVIIGVCYLVKNSGEAGTKFHAIPGSECMLTPDSSDKKPIVNFGFALIVEGEILLERFREHFTNCFLGQEEDKYDKFYCHMVTFGGYVFRASESSISIDRHIYERRLDQGETLEKFLAKWVVTGYGSGNPCWEIVLIPGLEMNNTGIAFKIHHALADGYSVLHILDKLTNHTSPYLVKDYSDGVGKQIMQMLEAPLNLSKMAGDPETNPFRVTLSSDRIPEVIISFTSLPLKELKQIRREHNVHMTSVILALIGGALREFALEKNPDPDQLQESFGVGNTVPVPRHPSKDPRTPNKDKLCNHWVAALIKVPLKEPDPIQRLRKIEEDLASFLELGMDKFMKRILFPVLWAMPRVVLEKGMMSNDVGVGAGLTSLIGGDNYSLFNQAITHIHPFLQVHDNNAYVPLSTFTFSHSGKMELTLGAHPSVFKDQATLDDFCLKCHNELNKFFDKKQV